MEQLYRECLDSNVCYREKLDGGGAEHAGWKGGTTFIGVVRLWVTS